MSDTTIRGTVEADRPDGMTDAEWEQAVDTLARGWLLMAGEDPALDLVSVESVPDPVTKMRYPTLHKGAMPHLVQVTYRGRATHGFKVGCEKPRAAAQIEPPGPRPGWDIMLLGLFIALTGSTLREFAEGDRWDAAILGLIAALILARAVPLRRPRSAR